MAARDYSKRREVRLLKLSPGKEREPGPLTDREISQMLRQGIIRSSHYLWLAEQYMIDMSKLGAGEKFDGKLAELSAISSYISELLDQRFK